MRLLEGVRVVELCQMVAGPYCTRLLADLGADVIKVEPPFTGDTARRKGPFVGDRPDQEGSLLFLAVNTSKRGITLDVRHPLGLAILERLVGWADLFVEDCRPSEAQQLGLEYSRLSASQPSLVMTSITPFGQTGPYRDYQAYPLNTFHSGGEGHLTPSGAGWDDRPPLKQGRYVGEYEVGLGAAIPTAAALFSSRATGLGQHVDISKQEVLVGLNARELLPYLADGAVPGRATRQYAIGGILPCRDGYVEIVLHEERQFQAALKMMGNPPWAAEAWFEDRPTRFACAAEVNERIAAWTEAHTKAEIFTLGQECGCIVAPYNTPQETVESPLLAARGFFQEVDHPIAGSVRCPTAAYQFAGEPVQPGPAPRLGQHNADIYCNLLGYRPEELAQMRAAGVV